MDSLQADRLRAIWRQAFANAQASCSSPAAPPAEVKQEVDDIATGHGTTEPVRCLTREDLEKMRRDMQEKVRRNTREKRRTNQLAKKDETDQKLRRFLLLQRMKRVHVPNTEANKRICSDNQVRVKMESDDSDDPIDLKRAPAASTCMPARFGPNPWAEPAGVARPQKAQPEETVGSKEAVGSKGKGTSRMLHPTAAEKVKDTEGAAKDARVQALLERRVQNKLRLLESQNKVAQHKITQLQKMLASEQQRCKVAEEECATLREQLDAMSDKTAGLREQLQIKKSLSSLSSGASWQFEIEGSWEAFTPEGNEKMHQAYMEYISGIPDGRYAAINSGGVARMVDFLLMQQQHLTTQKVRRIRLLTGVPPQWVTPAAELLQQGNELESFYKEVTDQEIWDAIHEILTQTGHAWDASNQCSCMRRQGFKGLFQECT